MSLQMIFNEPSCGKYVQTRQNIYRHMKFMTFPAGAFALSKNDYNYSI